eukprot:scaffold47230_cov63-Phaeocystis_antarctica.AAC.2
MPPAYGPTCPACGHGCQVGQPGQGDRQERSHLLCARWHQSGRPATGELPLPTKPPLPLPLASH